VRVIMTYSFADGMEKVDQAELDRIIESVYTSLGYLVVQSSELDDVLFDLYWVATGKPRPHAVADLKGMTLGAMVRRVLDAFKANINDATLLAKLAAVEPRLQQTVVARNEFIHASYAVSMDGCVHRERRPRERAVEQTVKMKPDDIAAAGDEVGGVSQILLELYDATVEFRGDLPPQAGEIRGGVTYPHNREYIDTTK
jgi:hypothetical protein